MTVDGSATVGLLADPGVPRQVAAAVADELSADLTTRTGQHWTVDVREESLPITAGGDIPLMAEKREVLHSNQWRWLVYLSDLTHYRDATPVRYQLSGEEPAIVVFVPAYGWLRKTVRIRRLLGDLILADLPPTSEPLPRESVRPVERRPRQCVHRGHGVLGDHTPASHTVRRDDDTQRNGRGADLPGGPTRPPCHDRRLSAPRVVLGVDGNHRRRSRLQSSTTRTWSEKAPTVDAGTSDGC